MASGGVRIKTGTYTATGSAVVVDTVGFRPQKVELYDPTTSHLMKAVWTEAMADGTAFKQVGATQSFITSNGITPDANGFTVGTDSALNNSGDTVYWVAFE